MGGDNRVEGEGLSGTCIKDTWTKPKGVGSRVGSGDGWGGEEWCRENKDNCTWTTIKNVREKKEKNPMVSWSQ